MNRIPLSMAVAALAIPFAPALAGEAFVAVNSGSVYRTSVQGTQIALPTMCTQIVAMVSDGPNLWIADQFQNLYRVNPVTHDMMSFFLPAPATSIAAGGGKLLVGSADGKIRRLDPASGAVLNTWQVSSDLKAMVLVGDTVFAGGSNTFVYKGSATVGAFGMAYACGGQVMAMTEVGTQVLAGTPTGVVYRFDKVSGASQGNFTVSGANINGLALDGQSLVVSDASGVVRRVSPATGALYTSSTVPEAATALALLGGCRPDVTGDGLLNVGDFSAYLAAYTDRQGVADADGDGRLTVQDFSAYLRSYAQGCH